MPADGKRGLSLAKLFWIAACVDIGLVLAAALKIATDPPSRYDFIIYVLLLAMLGLVGLVIGGVALIRNRLAYGIGLALVLALPLFYAGQLITTFATTPGAKALQTGQGYFSSAADRALAEAIVAGDGAKVASLAASANPNAVGWNGMTFMRLALEDGHANPAVVAALLKAGADPDQDNQLLLGPIAPVDADYGVMMKERNEPLLRAVIDAGIDLNRENRQGYPRFFSALQWPEGLALMLDHGAKTEVKDKNGYTAIMWAVMLRYWPSIDVLLAHGARLDDVAPDGQSLRSIVLETSGRLQGDIPPQLAALQVRLQ